MSSLSNRFIFPLRSWRGATFAQKRLHEGDIQVIMKEMRASGYKFVQKVEVKSYAARSAANEAQMLTRARFMEALSRTDTALSDPSELSTYQAKFLKQFRYPTLRGYIFADKYKALKDENWEPESTEP